MIDSNERTTNTSIVHNRLAITSFSAKKKAISFGLDNGYRMKLHTDNAFIYMVGHTEASVGSAIKFMGLD